jgi:phage recombination protein Bet
MSNALQLTQTEWTPEQLKLITDVVAKNASPDELKLFLYRCKSMGLDPMKPGQIHFVKYGNGPGTIVVGIEGFRSKAARTGKMAGIKREVLRDEKGQCVGARCTVWRTDWPQPAIEEVALSEYNTKRGPWLNMPETMIKKVAECATLRMAFPDDLGGVYAPEEMDQAGEREQLGVRPEQPGPNDGNTDPMAHGYRIPFGKYAQRPLEQIDTKDLASYIGFLERSAERKGTQITGQVKEFIERAEAYIAAMENAPIEEVENDIPVGNAR